MLSCLAGNKCHAWRLESAESSLFLGNPGFSFSNCHIKECTCFTFIRYVHLIDNYTNTFQNCWYIYYPIISTTSYAVSVSVFVNISLENVARILSIFLSQSDLCVLTHPAIPQYQTPLESHQNIGFSTSVASGWRRWSYDDARYIIPYNALICNSWNAELSCFITIL